MRVGMDYCVVATEALSLHDFDDKSRLSPTTTVADPRGSRPQGLRVIPVGNAHEVSNLFCAMVGRVLHETRVRNLYFRDFAPPPTLHL